MMKVSVDREANALYVRFSEDAVTESAEIRPGIIVDYDARGRIVALEILNASQTVATPNLDRLSVEVG